MSEDNVKFYPPVEKTSALQKVFERLEALEERVELLEANRRTSNGGRNKDVQKELDDVYMLLKKTGLKFNGVAIAENLPHIDRQRIYARLETLRREGLIKFEKKNNQQGVYYWTKAEE